MPAPPAQPAPEPPPEPTPAPAIPVVAFASVESMVDAGIPDAGVFLPLRSGAFKWCFPLVKSCGDSSTGLVLVPANKSSVAWQVDEGAVPLPEPLDVTSPKPLQLAGSPPADLASQRLALPILDVAAAGDGRRVLVQSLGSDGLMAAPPEDLAPGPVAAPVPEGPSTLPPAPAEPPVVPAGGIFGRPTLARSSQFSENAPALVVLPAPSGNVVHGLRPDPSWEAGVEILPFFTRNSVPYLVRGADGTPGLFLARPIGFRSSDMKVEAGAGGGGSGGLADAAPPVLAMLAAAVVVELGIFAAQMRRRRYRLANGSARQSRFTRRGFSPSRR